VGAERQHYYNYLIVIMTVVAALMSIDAMVNLIDLAFACMAIPTMSAALLLSRRVMIAARVYFAQLDDTSRS
jgi:AGCS family alanine or glycine:cation symporter